MVSVVIVGGGVSGTGLAYHLRDLGEDVTLVEKGALGSGTTGKAVATFSWHAAKSEAVHDVLSRTWTVYSSFVEDGVLDFQRNGRFRVAHTEAFMDELRRTRTEQVDRLGLTVEELEPADVAEFGIDPASVGAGALYYPDVGVFQPGQIVRVLAAAASAAGVDIRTGEEVTDVLVEDGRVRGVETTAGTIEADVVVNAAGPWADEVNRLVGVSVPVKHSFGPVVEFEAPAGFSLPSAKFEDGLFFGASAPGRVFAGHHPESAKEDESAEGSSWDRAPTVDPDDEFPIEDEFRETVTEMLHRAAPALRDARPVDEYVGIRAITPDDSPVLGETGVEGFLAAWGMDGIGLSIGPGCAELVADYVRTGEETEELLHFSADRFD